MLYVLLQTSRQLHHIEQPLIKHSCVKLSDIPKYFKNGQNPSGLYCLFLFGGFPRSTTYGNFKDTSTFPTVNIYRFL
jgi:hypothetical protein